MQEELKQRSGGVCELCGANDELSEFIVEPKEDKILVCSVCKIQLEDDDKIDETHWHCLNDSMWSEVDTVKVVVYRMLQKLNKQDLLDMMYLEDDILQWAKQGLKSEDKIVHKDCNGVILNVGDSVTITKDLDVKGTNFSAKRGTTVKNISLPIDDETHIEGRVNGVKIMIKTEFLKKV
jgi:protein PhnA